MTVADVADNKANLIKDYGRHSNDTGSSEVQIALLTDRIQNLSEHFQQIIKMNIQKGVC